MAVDVCLYLKSCINALSHVNRKIPAVLNIGVVVIFPAESGQIVLEIRFERIGVGINKVPNQLLHFTEFGGIPPALSHLQDAFTEGSIRSFLLTPANTGLGKNILPTSRR